MPIELDDDLIEQALRLSNVKTQQEVVQQALENFVSALQRKQLLSLRGPGTWEGDLNQMRTDFFTA